MGEAFVMWWTSMNWVMTWIGMFVLPVGVYKIAMWLMKPRG